MNIDFNKISRDELAQIIEIFQSKKKVVLSNFFGLAYNSEYSVMCGEETILFRLPENDCHRLFTLCSNPEELMTMLKSLDSKYVINIPTKKEIDDWNNILVGSGFEHYATYSHYMNLTVPTMGKRETSTGTFAKPSESQQVYDLLYRNFPIYAAHLPNKEELAKMIEEKRVIADYDESGEICGVNIFTITGSTAYGNAWVDEGTRGLEIFFDMFNIFIDRGIKRFVFWIRDGNKKVIKMHKMMGAKPDGLKDYTYVKNIKRRNSVL